MEREREEETLDFPKREMNTKARVQLNMRTMDTIIIAKSGESGSIVVVGAMDIIVVDRDLICRIGVIEVGSERVRIGNKPFIRPRIEQGLVR